MARADVTIAQTSAVIRTSQGPCLVKTSSGVRYNVFASSVDSSLYWTKSTDGGFTWTDAVLVKSLGGVNSGYCIWYEKWTPSDSGTKIWIWYFDSTNDDVACRYLDTNDDSLGSEVVVFAGGTTGAASSTCISGTKSRGGNLYVAFDIDAGTETGFYRSTDTNGTWGARTDVNEATSDYYRLAPGFAADNQDIICIFWDRSNDELSRKLYDDSGNSWAESSIATSMADVASSTAAPQFDIVVSAAASKVYLAAWNAADLANQDLRFWTIDESAITEGTNIVANATDDCGMVALGLATDTTTLYAFYGGKSDGSETFPTAINIYYKTSTDAGSTWGSETLLTLGTRGYDYLSTFPTFTGFFGAAFQSQTAALDTLLFSTLIPQARARMAIGVS